MTDRYSSKEFLTEVADDRTESYDRAVKRLANSLRRLADEVERDGADVTEAGPFDTNRLRYTKAARHLVHTLLWGTANLGLDGLIDAAAEADDAALKAAEAAPGEDNR